MSSAIPPSQPPSSPATASTGNQKRWDAITWATVINSFLTLAAVVVALFLGIRSVRVAEESLVATSESLKQNNLATIYTLGGELTKFDEENPRLAKFIDKHLRGEWVTKEEFWASYDKLPETEKTKERRQEFEKMWSDFNELTQDEKIKLYLGCQKIGDFSQIAFIQRNLLPDEDWNSWWSYITDQYDEAPFYRIYLAKRTNWYAFQEAVQAENRAEYFRRK